MERELIEKHKLLFHPFFPDEEELEAFIQEKLDFMEELAPRRMLNSIQRLVTLSDEIDVIRPGRRDLSVFFLVTCIESLYQHIPNHGLQKQEMVIRFFDEHMSQLDRKTIEDGIEIFSVNEEIMYQPEIITIEQFALLLTAIRNNVAHEGYYWSFQFNEEGDEGQTINVLKSKLRKDEGTRNISYEVALSYSKFRNICIRTFISFLNAQFVRIQQECLFIKV